MENEIFESLWSKYDTDRHEDFINIDSMALLKKLEKYAKTDEQKKNIMLEQQIVSIMQDVYMMYIRLELNKSEDGIIGQKISKFVKECKSSSHYFEHRKKSTTNFWLQCTYHIGCYLISHSHENIIHIMKVMFIECEKFISNGNYNQCQHMLIFLYNINKKYNLDQTKKIISSIISFAHIGCERIVFLLNLCKLASKIKEINYEELLQVIKLLIKQSDNEKDPYTYKDVVYTVISILKPNTRNESFIQSLKEKFAKRLERFADIIPEPMLAIEFLSHANEIYNQIRSGSNKNHVENRISNINIKISEKNKKLQFKKIEHRYSVKKLDIPGDTGLERIESIIMFFNEIVPSTNKIYEMTDKNARAFPLQAMFQTIRMGEDYPISISTTDEGIRESKFIDNYLSHVRHYENILSISIRELEKSCLITPKNYYDYVEISAIYDQANNQDNTTLKIMQAGFNHHCNGKYMESMHLLMPQIEDILRRLLIKYGMPSTRIDNKSYTLNHTLGNLISNSTSIFRNDIIKYMYMKLLKEGMNQRNKLCHGMSTPDLFTHSTSLSIICIILFLVHSYNYTQNHK